MFKLVAVLFAVLAAALCASISEPEVVPIISQSNEAAPDGSHFQWQFESGDGTAQQQTGDVVNVDKDTAIESVQGSVSYTDPEGHKHETSYVANENGFQPQSADIPVPPPVPAAIQKSLEYQAAHPHSEVL